MFCLFNGNYETMWSSGSWDWDAKWLYFLQIRSKHRNLFLWSLWMAWLKIDLSILMTFGGIILIWVKSCLMRLRVYLTLVVLHNLSTMSKVWTLCARELIQPEQQSCTVLDVFYIILVPREFHTHPEGQSESWVMSHESYEMLLVTKWPNGPFSFNRWSAM